MLSSGSVWAPCSGQRLRHSGQKSILYAVQYVLTEPDLSL